MAYASNAMKKNKNEECNLVEDILCDMVNLFKLKPIVIDIHSTATFLEKHFASVAALRTGLASEGIFKPETYGLAKLNETLNSSDTQQCDIVRELVRTAIETLEYLGRVANKKEVEAKDGDVTNKIKKLLEKATHLHEMMNSPQETQTPAGAQQGNAIPNATAGGRASDQACDNAKLQAHIAQRTLELDKENSEKMAERARQDQKALTDILIEMQYCNINKIDFEEAIKLLQRGLEELAKLKSHWFKLAEFFSEISSFINAQFGDQTGPLVDLKKYKELVYDRAKNNSEAKFQIKKLKQSAKRLEGGSNCITVATAVYLKISDRFVMPNLSSLDAMIALQSEKRKEARNALLPDCEKSSKEIFAICEKEFGSSPGKGNAPNE